ncbi:MAG TPA: N-acetyltransferase [Candidatus Acidoferrum sp.]|nr:N-acetyltransferase [Candidatus Acidoferrum sp.]
MAVQLRPYAPSDFDKLYTLDHQCFPRGIAYSQRMLAYFLRMPQGHCIVAADGAEADAEIVAFLITEEDAPLGHILTLDVAGSHRRLGLGTQLLARGEEEMAARGVREVLLETGIDNQAGVAFWQRHGYRTEDILKGYYLGRLDAYRMRKKIIAL